MAAPRSARDRGPLLCEYFVTCERVADGMTSHPVAGEVPICGPCAALAGVERSVDLPAQSAGRSHDQYVQHANLIAHQPPTLAGGEAAPAAAGQPGPAVSGRAGAVPAEGALTDPGNPGAAQPEPKHQKPWLARVRPGIRRLSPG
jgi:hypothetical protein